MKYVIVEKETGIVLNETTEFVPYYEGFKGTVEKILNREETFDLLYYLLKKE
jgi:hypothetical protein